ncbi:MAG TPA: bifunctional uridylyltransferase/uridylyl-removing protein, partial [Acetobacteraceae bacterium]|nr:bifunctional uridylyltransferase/uridylyl-removing protein [Acetobacteraceae bacterium]
MFPPTPLPTEPADAIAQLRRTLTCESAPLPRDAALGLFRRHLGRMQSLVRDMFESGAVAGMAAARLLSAMTDGLLVALFEYSGSVYRDPESQLGTLAMAATGGYGRGILAPFSDIDLLFLTLNSPGPAVLRRVEFMLYFLWDLGLKVGHATRSIEECLREANADTTVCTSLLDGRLLAGDDALFAQFEARFLEARIENGPGRFLGAKQAERAARHRRYGDSPFVVEPNIKESRGGLRDFQTLYWMARYVYGTRTMMELADPEGPAKGVITLTEAKLARRSADFLWSLRFHLHYVAGRAEERLTFDLQPVVGARMGYTRHGRQDGVERFMRHYFLTAREVTRLTHVLEPALQRAALGPPAISREADAAVTQAGFVLAEGKLLAAPGRDFRDEPLLMLRMLKLARDRDLRPHPLALRALIRNERRALLLRDSPEAATLFLDLLCGGASGEGESVRADSARWLKILNETGFLGRYLPDWARIVGQMQFDTYHIYTVDEHTIEAIRVLNTMERGELVDVAPVATGLIDHLQSRRALYVAVL